MGEGFARLSTAADQSGLPLPWGEGRGEGWALRADPLLVLKIRRQVHAGVKARHLIAVAVERKRRPALCEQAVAIANPPFGLLAPARVIDFRVYVGIEAILAWRSSIFQDVTGCLSTRLIRTIDLMLLKPYFHGTTSLSGAPFWFGSVSP